MIKIKRKNTKLILIILLLCITIGYAILSSNVNINGSSKIKNATWNIHFDNLRVVDGSVPINEDDIAARINPNNNTEVNYKITLNKPTDYYEFLVDVVNEGSIDAMIDNVSSKIKVNENDYEEITDNNIPNYLKYKVTYLNDTSINSKQELKSGDRETYKVRIEFNKDINNEDLPQTEQNIEFKFEVNYVQKDDTSEEIPKLEIGKYFTLVPDKTSYTISKNDTGYDGNQTINPKELSLWRIININNDGTIDAISEYLSSKNIYFYGVKGYSNYIDALENIANQYKKEGYTIDTRMMGYNGQTKIIENTTTNIQTEEEYNGGILGDSLYLKDYNLVNNTYKENGLKAYKVNDKTTPARYWLASREYLYTSDSNYQFSLRNIDEEGRVVSIKIRSFKNEWKDQMANYALRPIITLKNNIGIKEGKGELNNPYILS